MANFEVITQSTVNVAITSSISSFSVEKRYPKNLTIGELKVLYLLLNHDSCIALHYNYMNKVVKIV
jgi:hypothetical protein